MLKPKKKFRRKELKEDKLVTTYFKLYNRIYEHRKPLIIAASVFLVIVMGFIIYKSNVQAENLRALTELGKIYNYYDKGDYRRAISGVPDSNIRGFEDVARNYRNTEAGKLAVFYLANSYYHLGEYDEAYRYFNEYRGSDRLLKASALAGRGAIYEMRGDHASAAELFERAAIRFGDLASTPENLKHAGRNFMEAGNYRSALRIFEKLKEEHSGSAVTRDVDLYIAQIKQRSA